MSTKRQYNYEENLIRENSRIRKKRKQLTFTKTEYVLIERKILENEANSFSEYIRDCIRNKKINRADLENYSTHEEFKTKRKQICFDENEIELINSRMKKLGCENFNLFITTVAIV